MIMNNSTSVSLVAAAVSTVLGTSARALPPSAWNGPMFTFYAGGGSAEAQAVYVAVSKLLTNVDVYTDGTGTTLHPQSLSYLIISGTAKQAFGSACSGCAVGFIYKYNGGSLPNGAEPEYIGNLLAYPTNALIASTAAPLALPTGGNAAQYPSSVYPDYEYTPGNTTSVLPDWGITDEEPALFNYPWNLNNGFPIPLSGATATPLYVAPFGVAVTNTIYQYKHNFSKAEVAGILAGTVSDWSQLQGDTGSYAGKALPAGGVILIDRGSGSGTKAAGNAYFLDYPAGSYKIGGAITPESVTTAPFNANGGYTALSLTLTATQQDIKEPSSAAEADDLVAANQAGLGAIAILGLEYPPAFEQVTTGANDYWFVSINGSYPDSETAGDNVNSPTGGNSTSYSNLINGKYDFAFQTSFNTSGAVSSLSAFEAAVYANLSAANISEANTAFPFPESTPGVLLDPTKFPNTAGSLSWTRNHDSVGAPIFIATQPAAK
jgi:hypothetical protein